MHLGRFLPGLVLVCGLSASVACDDPLRPTDVAGTYLLRAFRQEPLPTLIWEAGGDRMRLLSDSLVLKADGMGYEVWHVEFSRQGQATVGRSEHPFRFEVHGRRLEGTYVCLPGAACLAMIEPLAGEFTPRGLRLDTWKRAAGPLLFDRQ